MNIEYISVLFTYGTQPKGLTIITHKPAGGFDPFFFASVSLAQFLGAFDFVNFFLQESFYSLK
jgi:hypothetical protein